METAEPPEPLDLFAISVLFRHWILLERVGPAARHFQYIQCILWTAKLVFFREHLWFQIDTKKAHPFQGTRPF